MFSLYSRIVMLIGVRMAFTKRVGGRAICLSEANAGIFAVEGLKLEFFNTRRVKLLVDFFKKKVKLILD